MEGRSKSVGRGCRGCKGSWGREVEEIRVGEVRV